MADHLPLSKAEDSVRIFSQAFLSTPCPSCSLPLATTRKEILRLAHLFARIAIDCPYEPSAPCGDCGRNLPLSRDGILLLVLCNFDEGVLYAGGGGGGGGEDGEAAAVAADARLCEVMRAVADALWAAVPSEMGVQDLILCSKVLDVVAELLDAATLEEMEKRDGVYQELVWLLAGLLAHQEAFGSLMASSPRRGIASSDLFGLCLPDEERRASSVFFPSITPSVAVQIREVAARCEKVFGKDRRIPESEHEMALWRIVEFRTDFDDPEAHKRKLEHWIFWEILGEGGIFRRRPVDQAKGRCV